MYNLCCKVVNYCMHPFCQNIMPYAIATQYYSWQPVIKLLGNYAG